MLKNLAEYKLSANFTIIEDKEDGSGQDLFIAFLKNWDQDTSIKQIHLVCFENRPSFYTPDREIESEKVIFHDFFSDPCGWNNPSGAVQDFRVFASVASYLAEAAIFIDSLSLFAYHEGFFNMCRNLSTLKRLSKNVVCGVHGDLFTPEQLEELYFFASACIKLEDFSSGNIKRERMCEVTYKKPGGKVIKQKESFFISNEFKISCRISKTKSVVASDTKSDMESLSTFKLGLHISEGEKKARDELVLPYLKTDIQNKTGEIIYKPEADDFEDDPDDDLDI